MSDVFGHMVIELSRISDKKSVKSISKEDYEIFCKEFIFEKIKGVKFGEAFTERFEVNDFVLMMYTNDQDAIKHIKYCNYVK